MQSIALIGQPNSGKSSLFNEITSGAKAKVANYAGATVEFNLGQLQKSDTTSIVDLPGLYELVGGGAEEAITLAALAGTHPTVSPDACVVVVDGTTIERAMSLVAGVQWLGIPFVVAINMADNLEAEGVRIDITKLEQEIGAPVHLVSAQTGQGLDEFVSALGSMQQQDKNWRLAPVSATRIQAILTKAYKAQPHIWPAPVASHADHEITYDPFTTANIWIGCTVTRVADAKIRNRTRKIDSVLLHPVAGIFVFLAVMFLIFQSVFSWSVPLVDLIELALETLSTQVVPKLPMGIGIFVNDVLIGGVGAVLVFLPQILILFFWLSILEQSGYLSRIAFLIDGPMRAAGLSGSSFIPLLSSHACAVPGIMAARTIADPAIRLLTILIAPLMACSARLPVYTLIIAAFVPDTDYGPVSLRGLTMFALYGAGVVGGLFLAKVIRSRVDRGTPITMIIDLPLYRRPRARVIAQHLMERVNIFMRRAGTVIFTMSAAMWVLMNVGWSGADLQIGAQLAIENSIAGRIGHLIEPLIQPLGFDWKIGIALIGSFAAREVMVSILGTIYAIEGASETSPLLLEAIQNDPVWDFPTAVAMLIWYVFALQCLSTVAIMKRETGGWKWPMFSLASTYGMAWILGALAYNILSL